MKIAYPFRYINGTLDNRLTFKKSTRPLELVAFSDSDWASSPDRKSTTSYYFSLSTDGPALSWKTRKQATIALSSCEAEYMALCDTAKETIYLSKVLKDFSAVLKSPKPEPVWVHVDNQGAIALAKNPVHHERSKHIDIKYHFSRECVANGHIRIAYVRSDDNISDVMTKAASKLKLSRFRKALFG